MMPFDKLTDKQKERLEKVIEGIKAYQAEKAIIFGSYASGKIDEYSDLDAIVIKQTDKRFFDRLQELGELIKPDFALDILVYTPREVSQMLAEGNSFLETAFSEGKVIYEKSGKRGV